MVDEVGELLTKRNFTVVLDSMRQGHHAVWLLCVSENDSFLVRVGALYLSLTTVFHCDHVSIADRDFVADFRRAHPEYNSFYKADGDRFLYFHSGDEKHYVWYDKLEVIDQSLPYFNERSSTGFDPELQGLERRFAKLCPRQVCQRIDEGLPIDDRC